MNQFYIITNSNKDPNHEMTYRVKKYLESKGKKCILEKRDDNGTLVSDDFLNNIDGAIVLGGDGTLIRAARELIHYDIPILGVNIGTLGYLTEIEAHNIESGIDTLLEKKPMIENRMMLRGTINSMTEDVALNEIVVTRTKALRLIRFHVYVNGELLNTYQADGVIVSTATGSTGYNLSAGGPVVEPTASLIVVTPICSHALNASSIVLSAEDVITIEIGEGRDNQVEEAGVSFDGNEMILLETGEYVTITRAKEVTKLFKLSNASFLETMREKMKGN